MRRSLSTPPEKLKDALAQVVRHPLRTIAPPWSWKAATCTATVRAAAFYASNLRSGTHQATKATVVEAVFAIFAGGLIGALSQYLRQTKPLGATALFLCFALPGSMTLAQFGLHHAAGTQHQSSGLVTSFCLAAFAAAYTWYAMRHGAMLGGVDQTTIAHDLRVLPRVSLGFALAIPRMIRKYLVDKQVLPKSGRDLPGT